ncbi:MAG TPA: NB-ARC domain-containing protein [Ktedonobacteraceae bacterium]|nr:NB-ARC domain-containing protein [Ktedonobacteraceae bacterium]
MRSSVARLSNERLRQERQRRGWSREYVAEQIGIADAKTIGRWERGVAFPRAYFVQKLCTLFGMLAQDLGLCGESSSCTDDWQTSQENSSPFSTQYLYDPAIPLLSAQPDGLVGRDDLLNLLKQHLCRDDTSPALSALYGLPGVGKTALAIELVHCLDVQRYFSDGMLWVSLGPGPDISEQLRRWGGELRCTSAEMADMEDDADWARLLRARIGLRRMLLVIDDAWRSKDALAFKVGGPFCAYVLTTRSPSVALDFAGDDAISVRELNEDDGLSLLAHFVPDIVAGEPCAARALVQSVASLPLALTLMGKYLKSQTYSNQPRRRRAALERLSHPEERLRLTITQAPLEQHTSLSTRTPLSLEAVIGASVRQLDEVAQRTLLLLSVFPAKPSSFSEEAALAVTAATAETLDVLVDAGLLESIGCGRYTLHRTIADFARSRPYDGTADERMVQYFTSYVETHQDNYDALEQEIGNVLAALQLASERGMSAALIRGIIAYSSFLRARGWHELAEIHLERAQQLVQSQDGKLLSFRVL